MDIYIFLILIYVFPPARIIFSFIKYINGYKAPRKLSYKIGMFLHFVHFFAIIIAVIYVYQTSSQSGGEGAGWVLIFAIPIQGLVLVVSEILMMNGRDKI